MHMRTLGALAAPPAIKLSHLGKHRFDAEARAASEAKAAPYFEAFEAHKAERHRAIRKKCENLDAGPIVISTFNWGFRRLVENWAASCDRHGIDCRAFTLLFPMDEGADAFAQQLGFQTYFDGASYGELPIEACKVFGNADFRKCLFAKIATTQDMLEIGANVLRQDVDMVWMRDPRSYLTRRMERKSLDFLFMYDGPNHYFKPLYYNSGFVCIWNNQFTRYAWKLIFSSYPRMVHHGGEQLLINAILTALRDRGLRCNRLPEEVFVNGHVISKALADQASLPTSGAVIHASWTANLEKKLEHLKHFGLWYV